MMVFKFRMLSDENDNFARDYEVLYDMNLQEFHEFIRDSLGYRDGMVSFFTADERWEKKQEFTLVDMGDDSENAPRLMSDVTLGQILHHNRDRLIYLFDMFGDRAYYLELTGTAEARNTKLYPREVFARGEVPDQFDPTATEEEGSIFAEMMGDFNDYEGDDSIDDDYYR